MKLSDLAGPDASGFSDVAVFVDERGRESPRFLFHGISVVPGWRQAADVRYEHGGGMREPCLSRPVRRLGRGRLVPSRIEMEGEATAEAKLRELEAERDTLAASLDANWVTHQSVIAARNRAETAEAKLTAMQEELDTARAMKPNVYEQIISSERMAHSLRYQAEKSRDALANWKAQQLAVESEWDPQAVAQLLNVPPGQSIRAAIQTGIEGLQEQVAMLREACIQAALTVSAYHEAAKILGAALAATAPKDGGREVTDYR